MSSASFWPALLSASERLAEARSMEAIVSVLRDTARGIAHADGIAVVLRDGDHCAYVAEDAISPLWSGLRFPAETCVSGWAMQHRETVRIADVRLDGRVPQAAYRATFVRSMLMVPIGRETPVAALGAYWSAVDAPGPESVEALQGLARAAAIAVENVRLAASIEKSDRVRSIAVAAGRMGVWQLDLARGELTTSAACRENFGRDPSQPFSYQELHDAIHPEDKARVLAAIEASVATGADYDIEYRLLTPSGGLRWVGIRAQAEYDAQGRPLAMAGVSTDITERKEAERRLLASEARYRALVQERTAELDIAQDALRQAQKLEAMGQLTGGVAHDFNNLLTPIISGLDMLQRRGLGNTGEQRLIAGALQSAERAKLLVQRLLAFARRQPLQATAVDVGSMLQGMADLVRSTVGPTVQLRFEVARGTPLAQADVNQLELAVLNLAVNARDAMPEGGTLTMMASEVTADAELAPGLAPGRYVQLIVADTGIGMSDQTLARAIEPFFSTKGVGKGTGLGLSMVHGLAHQLQGGMKITSKPGFGTAVCLWLPVSAPAPGPVWVEAAFEPPAAVLGSALVVDDEDLVRQATAAMVAELGYTVVEASCAAEALALLEHHGRFDVVVTDHLMPETSGVELAHIMRSRFPSTTVLLVSGFAEESGVDSSLPRLNKPFRQAELAASLRAAGVGQWAPTTSHPAQSAG